MSRQSTASAIDQPMADFSRDSLVHVKAPVRFISFEPLLGPIFFEKRPPIDWMIIGAETRLGKPTGRTKKEWALDLAVQAGSWGIPLFVKDNIGSFGERPREFPKAA